MDAEAPICLACGKEFPAARHVSRWKLPLIGTGALAIVALVTWARNGGSWAARYDEQAVIAADTAKGFVALADSVTAAAVDRTLTDASMGSLGSAVIAFSNSATAQAATRAIGSAVAGITAGAMAGGGAGGGSFEASVKQLGNLANMGGAIDRSGVSGGTGALGGAVGTGGTVASSPSSPSGTEGVPASSGRGARGAGAAAGRTQKADAAAPTGSSGGWTTAAQIGGLEVSIDTVNYRRVSDAAGDASYRVPARLRYRTRTAQNAALWDQGARMLVLDQEVFCVPDGSPNVRTHRVVAVRADGTVVGEQPVTPEWITPPPKSAGGVTGRAVCRLLAPATE